MASVKRYDSRLSWEKVLDLGCGMGWHSKYLFSQGASSVLGIDLSKKMLEKAKEINNTKCITDICESLENYEYPKDTYDLVISNLVLHYIEDLEEIYSKIYRTLKPGGTFFQHCTSFLYCRN